MTLFHIAHAPLVASSATSPDSKRQRTRRRRRNVLALTTTVGFVVATIFGIAHPASSATTLTTRVLTSDGTDTYSVSLYNGSISMSAPSTNGGTNLREVFWPSSQRSSKDSQVCATWSDQSSPSVQQGVALRVVTGSGRTRALTVTKNIWGGAYWVFNVHTWDSSSSSPFTLVSQHDMSSVVWADNQAKALPWRICARVIGPSLTFKVWLPDRETEPSWNDQTHMASTTVPSDYPGSGKTGWYVGHIPPGGSAHYTGLQVQRLS
jgi:hypothetical protein